MELKKYKDLVYQIIGSAMTVHAEMRWGLLEPVYQEALSWELNQRNITNIREQEIEIYYKNHKLDKKYKMDVLVGDIVVEIKSVVKMLPAHRAQLCNYLRLSRKPIGILINFGEKDLIGERWAYDEETNECFLIDKNMIRVFNKDYNLLLHQDCIDSEYE